MGGFLAGSRASARLAGYAVGFTLVEGMDAESFAALYMEYRGRHGCKLSLEEFVSLAGTLPGLLPDLCPRSPSLLREWIREGLTQLEEAISMASEMLGVSVEEAVEIAARLLAGGKASSARELRLAEALVETDIAYPCRGRLVVLPQLPIYLSALQTAQRNRVSLEEVEPQQLLTMRPRLLRCKDL